MSFPVHVPGGGGGISQLTGGVVAGPGTGSVAANVVSLTKTVDCTNAGTFKIPVSVTAFDGTYATISGLGATGALVPPYFYANVNPTLFGPALGGGTFNAAAAGVTAFDGVHTATISNLFGMFPGIVGSTITFTGATSGGNNGTFVISAYLSPSSVQITNASAVAPDASNFAISWTTTTGTTANVTAFSTPLATITGLAGITPSMVGKNIGFSGFTNLGNNGSFQIAAFISSSSVQVTNTSAVSPDSGATWSIAEGTLDTETLILTVDPTILGTVVNVLNYQGMFEVQTAAPTSLITGDTVNIIGILGNGPVYQVNGTHTVTVIDSTHFALQGTVFTQVYYSGGGTVQTGPLTLTLNAATNTASSTAFLAAITSAWPTVTATLGGGVGFYGTNLSLILTGTTLGNAGSITIGAGTANSALSLFQSQVYTGTEGVSVGGQSPTALQLGSFSNAGNNGTFNVHQWIDSATVTVFNPAAVTPDSGTHAIFSTGFYNDILSGVLYGPALSGSAATITSFTTPLATVDGLTGMTPAIVGQTITFSSGFTNGGNVGTFPVVGYLSATSIVINNASAVSPDSGGVWSVPAGHLDGTTLIISVDGGSLLTLTLNGSTNAASMSAFFAAIEATWPALTPSPNPTQGSLVLTENTLFGPNSTFTLGSGTANTWLGINPETISGLYANASFALSLASGSPPISGASVLLLTGAPVTTFALCTQSVGPFRCQVENNTSTFNTASFATTAFPSVAYGTSIGVSSDGTTINYDAPIPATPPAYVVGSQTGNLSGSTVFVDPSPNTPFTLTLSGGVTGVGSVVVQQLPFYSFVINGSTQSTTVSDNNNHTAQKILGAGQAALVAGDGTSVWMIPTITEDNGRAKRYDNYLTVRAATGSNLVNTQNSTLNGGDVVWGTSISGGPFNQGVVAPFMDGSFDTALTDNAVGMNPVSTAVAGADIGVLGNIVYMAGYNSGSASLYALSVGTGSLIAQTTLTNGLPTTLIAFKEAADPLGSIGGPTDCVFIVCDGSATTYGLNTTSSFAQFQNFSGSWENARGVLLMGDNASATLSGGAFYSSIGVWTDPINNEIWAADVVNGEIGITNPISVLQPTAICLDREAGNFWVVSQGNQQIVLMNMNLTTGLSLATTIVNTISFPSQSDGVINDILFDGAFLWAISVPGNYLFQMTPNGFVVSAYYLQSDSGVVMLLTNDSRLYFDGSFVWLSGMSREGESVIASINPGTGLPVEYFTFPVVSTRGLAFHGNELFVATAPTINLNNSTTNTGSFGTITTTDSGGSASITGTAPNVTLTGLTGIYQGTVGQNITLSGTFGGANDGSFPVVSVVSQSELLYNNAGATIPDTNNGSISWSVTGTCQFSDTTTPANWSSGVVGQYIYLANSAFPQNDGLWQIVSWTSSTQIGIASPNANGDPGGTIEWQMYGTTCGIQRMVSEPPGTDFGTLDSIIKTPAVAGWARGMRLGARVVEYTSYTGPTTFEIDVNPLPGTRVLFVDKDGNSPTNPLTISTPFATINGQTSCTLQGPYAFLEIEWDGTKWLIVRQSNQVTGGGSTRPVNPTLGQVCFDANVGLPIWWNGSQWINAAGIPV